MIKTITAKRIDIKMTYACSVNYGAGDVDFYLIPNEQVPDDLDLGAFLVSAYPEGDYSVGHCACTEKTVSDPSRVHLKNKMTDLRLEVEEHSHIVELMKL